MHSYKAKSVCRGIIATTIFFCSLGYLNAQDIIIPTRDGYIKGMYENDCFVFKGIPYAQPPIGKLRFKAPVRVKPWSDTLDCTRFGPIASQTGNDNTVAGSEDCLSLNVYTKSTAPVKPQPVLVWIHGGGMTGGSGRGTNGHAFADNDSIVAITINYRLGAFGFLELNDLGEGYAASGNNAVLDCIAALKWIKHNIQKFGGDPDRITIAGQSAGAKLVSAILVTPLSKGLVNAAIPESGATQCIRDTVTAKAIRKRLFDILKITDPADILSIPTDKIIQAQSEVLGGAQGTNYFGPVLDGIVYKEAPLQYIAEKRADRIRLLTGTTKSEARLFMDMDKRLYHPTEQVLKDWFGDNGAIVYKRFKEGMKTNKDTASVAVPLLTQYMYQMHSYRLANAFSDAGYDVHVYRFDYGSRRFGASHGDELKYVWYVPNDKSDKSGTASALIKAVHGDWVHFIKNEKPISDDPWPLYKSTKPVIKAYNTHTEIETLIKVYNDETFPSSCFILKK